MEREEAWNGMRSEALASGEACVHMETSELMQVKQVLEGKMGMRRTWAMHWS